MHMYIYTCICVLMYMKKMFLRINIYMYGIFAYMYDVFKKCVQVGMHTQYVYVSTDRCFKKMCDCACEQQAVITRSPFIKHVMKLYMDTHVLVYIYIL